MAAAQPNLFKRLRAGFYYSRGRMHRHWGNLSGDRREYQAAVDDFSKALELHPSHIAACYSRGVLYWRELQNYYRAVKDMTRVLELAPHWHEAWFNRALAHQLRGENSEAMADYEHYLGLPGLMKYHDSAQTQLDWIKFIEEQKTSRQV
jgi:tetratricopeptide (TPR) repeat protein